jgi:DNA-directed RNA polymerase subunit RPC12/RpoP
MYYIKGKGMVKEKWSKAWAIQHGLRLRDGSLAPNGIGQIGSFTTKRDAERYLEDNPTLPTPKIYETTAKITIDHGADCPDCAVRADRAWDKGYTGSIALWWRCPKCGKEFTR